MTFEPKRISDFLAVSFDTVIDVRSPAEFKEDHVPGAINLPVFSNEERARVGTIYTQRSPFLARKIGAAILARNAAAHIEGPLADMEGGWQPLVYCWRGGQRSNAFAVILKQIGWRVSVLQGGYKTWRRLVVEMLHTAPLPYRFILLDGYTGTAKTEVLRRVAERGGQVLDLEALANHRGSVLGGQGEQPAQKGFESALAAELARLDPARPVLVEAESSRIGGLNVPPSVWAAMCDAPDIFISAPEEARAEYLARTYADTARDLLGLEQTLTELVPLQGRARVEDWIALAKDGNHVALATDLMRHHYDPRYRRSRRRHARSELAVLDLANLGADAIDKTADRIVSLLDES